MNWVKATGLSVGGIILGSVLAMQAFTNVLANDQPALAASASPLNGFALERVALNSMKHQESGSLAPLVKKVVAKEPLSPAAWTMLALAQEDGAKKDAILLAASNLNRRTLLLQSNLLLLFASRDDFFNSIGTLNQILTVHPEQQGTMFPILIQALKDERSIPEFVRALSQKPSWSDSFLRAASVERDTLPNLTQVRMGLFDKVAVERDTDKAIIGALVKTGRIEPAAALYKSISEPSAGGTFGSAGKFQKVDWNTNMPPFDWQLKDDPSTRAEVRGKPERLVFFVKSGKADTIAERLTVGPNSPFVIKIVHDMVPLGQLKDVKIRVECAKRKETLIERAFLESPSIYSVSSIPENCGMINISIFVRAWSDKPDLKGEIRSIAILPQPF
ncbi:hypothetical protein [Sphingorhabdus sp. YGSMI21]|uniref:hypothetical protein n=1 Tax=Sphingorhabdus sp. YGSMI21 TaxID=2077182 RepID=UPI000C1E410B|nr:hypothetical protein [Sphingorhabdus sp. YGSMI21]ATW03136.1 hypothetical protein CHN51_05945 [Sphingorhabdus sp. YGSMI21]